MVDPQPRPSGFNRVVSDIIDLCELQWQLLSVDSQEAKRRAVRAAILLIVGLLFVATALLAGINGTGHLIHELTQLSIGASFLITAAVGLVFAGVTVFLGLRQLSKANESLSETKRELGENVRWLKAVILSPQTSARNQLRHGDFGTEFVPSEESRFQHMH